MSISAASETFALLDTSAAWPPHAGTRFDSSADRPLLSRYQPRPSFLEPFRERVRSGDGPSVLDRAAMVDLDAWDDTSDGESGSRGLAARLAASIDRRWTGIVRTFQGTASHAGLHRDNARKSSLQRTLEVDVGSAEARLDTAIRRISRQANPTSDQIVSELNAASADLEVMEQRVHAGASRIYETDGGDAATAINVTVTPAAASSLPTPIQDALVNSAEWLASKVRDNAVARIATKTIAALVLVMAWLAPIGIAAGISFLSAGTATIPVTTAAAVGALLVTNYFELLWAALNKVPAQPTITIQSGRG